MNVGLRGLIAEAYLRLEQQAAARQQLEQALAESARLNMDVTQLLARQTLAVLGQEAGIALLRDVLAANAGDEYAAMRLKAVLARYVLEFGGKEGQAEAAQTADDLVRQAAAGSHEFIFGWLLKARAAEIADDAESACKAYEEVLKYDENNVQSLNNLAYALVDKLSRPAEALPYAERAEKLAPDNSDVLDTVGWVFFQNNKGDRAESYFLEALRINRANVAARYHLGQLYAKAGRNAEARKAFQLAIDDARQLKDTVNFERASAALSKLP
jgi:tetratricopeptide (TPR) repeat protein